MSNLTRKKFIKLSAVKLTALTLAGTVLNILKPGGESYINNGVNPEIKELKKMICGLQEKIRKDKISLRKRGKAGRPCGHIDARLHVNRKKIRHYLIAYSELRGKKRSQIEHPGLNNLPSEHKIIQVKNHFS